MPLTASRTYLGNFHTASFTLTVMCFLFFGLSIFLSNRILNFSILLMDSARGVKFEIVRGNLILNKMLSGQRKEEQERMRYYLSAAQRQMRLLIKSGKSIFTWLTPLNDEELQRELAKINQKIERLTAMSGQLHDRIRAKGSVGFEDKNYDLFFDSLLNSLDGLEIRIRSIVNARLANVRQVQYLLTLILFSIIAITVWYSSANLVIRRKMEQSLTQNLERKVVERTRQLKAVNKELETFAYSVSHDLRAPLRSIEGFGQALLEDYLETLDGTGQDYLNRVLTNAKRMRDLIENMLVFSSSIRCELNKVPVDLSTLAQKVMDEIMSREKERRVFITIAPNMIAHGDSHLLRIVLENLLDNAWKFTNRNSGAAWIEFASKPKNGAAIYYVKDNGAGFDMTHSDKLFSAFQRLHAAAEYPGTGVGLATVARIIERHGGKIWAKGDVGQGATFYFSL